MNNTPTTFIKEDPWRIFRIMAEFHPRSAQYERGREKQILISLSVQF